MTDAVRDRGRFAAILSTLSRSPFALWAVFVLVHLWLGLLNLFAPGWPLGDVTLTYKFWVDQALSADFWVGIHSQWVYPIVAMVPMLASATFGTAFFGSTWLTLVMILNAVAFGVLTGWGRSHRNLVAGWWWVGFLLLLGPIALGRIDSVSVPIALIGMLFLATRPQTAMVLLTIATWIKVWPAALIGSIVVASKNRWTIVGIGAAVSGVIVAVALALGSGLNVFSFITQQTGRGLQVESPIGTVYMWLAALRVGGASVYYDHDILTFQVSGVGVRTIATAMTLLMALAVLAIVLLGVRAVRARVQAAALVPVLALALVTSLMVFNKVGSPQFVSWLAVPVIYGLVVATNHGGISFRTPAIMTLGIAALTQLFYPYLYSWLLGLNFGLLLALTLKNVLLVAMLWWASRTLWDLGSVRDGVLVPRASAAAHWPLPLGEAAKLDARTTTPTAIKE